MRDTSLHGAGLGLKRELIPDLKAADLANLPDATDFCELAPEIWLDMGGKPAQGAAPLHRRRRAPCGHGLHATNNYL